MNWASFTHSEIANKIENKIYCKIAYVDMTNDLIAGILLDKIIYWNLPDKNGNHTKLRIERNGYFWLVKSHTDWHNEIRISKKQVIRALGILKSLGLITTALHKFNNSPTTHIRINHHRFLDLYDNTINTVEVLNEPIGNIEQPQEGILNDPKGTIQTIPKGSLEQSQKGLSSLHRIQQKITTENTTNKKGITASVFLVKYYNKKSGKKIKLTTSRKTKFNVVLKDYSIREMIYAINGLVVDPWGIENGNISIERILDSGKRDKNIEKFGMFRFRNSSKISREGKPKPEILDNQAFDPKFSPGGF